MLTVAWYRFRATFHRRGPGYLSLILLIGLVGGLAMGAIAGARRTQSSYPTFLAGTNPSDLNLAVYNPATDGGPGPPLATKIAHLPGVKRLVRGHEKVPVFGQLMSPLVATRSPRFWPPEVPTPH